MSACPWKGRHPSYNIGGGEPTTFAGFVDCARYAGLLAVDAYRPNAVGTQGNADREAERAAWVAQRLRETCKR